MSAAAGFSEGSPHPTEALSALLDQELTPSEAAGVGHHLDACPWCRTEMGRLSEARDRLRRMDVLAAPPDLAERARDRIRRALRAVTVGAIGIAAVSAGVLWAARPERAVTAPSPSTLAVFVAAANDWPAGPTRSRPAAVPLDDLPPGYVAPSGLDGLDLESVWVRGQVLATVYGDGAGSVMLLEQLGRLVESQSGPAVVLGGRRGVLTRWGSKSVFTSQVGATVLTVLGYPDDLTAAVASVQGVRANPPWPYRARSICRSLVVDLTGG
ncbi:MAG: anti-sigma factor family protein [Acidimicrobiales bacterium]